MARKTSDAVRKYLREIGRRGGAAKSAAKAAASRKNGKLGGWYGKKRKND